MLEIKDTDELARIAALPRRCWSRKDLQALARNLTKQYKTPTGTMALFETQAQVLAECFKMGGGYTSAPVGCGKTLITALLPRVMKAKHPLLLVPANTKAKTFRDFGELRQHWQIPHSFAVKSYELLQHANQRNLLLNNKYDLIICDEVDNIKTTGEILGPRVRRLLEYLKECPDTRFVGLTGTPIRTSLMDFWTHLNLALKENCPLPRVKAVAEQWSEAVDVEPKKSQWGLADDVVFRDPRSLHVLGDGSETGTDREKAIECVQKRLVQSWGFVNVPGMSCTRPIYLRKVHDLELPTEIQDGLDLVESSNETLNGDILETPLEVASYRKQLICGFFYLWDPEPPKAWLRARKNWKSFVRDSLSVPGVYADSPHLVEQENLSHPYRLAWREIEGSFDADKNRKVAWVDTYFVDDVSTRIDGAPTIIWCNYIELGKAVAKKLKVKYYGGGARASSSILQESGDRTIVASIDAHGVGKNLQMFSRNLVLTPPTDAAQWEQMIGRTHRQGQNSKVMLDVYQHAPDLRDDLKKAVRRATFDQQMIGQPQKLLFAIET